MSGTVEITLDQAFLDAGNSVSFLEHMRARIGDQLSVVLGLESLEFIDSSGMGALVSLARDLEARNGNLALYGAKGAVKSAFELVYLRLKLHIFEDLESARGKVVKLQVSDSYTPELPT
ncbi:MAG: STAS domain-containing protein, partial [Spirochaetota bacterium]